MNLHLADQQLQDALAVSSDVHVVFFLEPPRLSADEMPWRIASLVEKAERRCGERARAVEYSVKSQSFRLHGHPALIKAVATDWTVMEAELVDPARAPAWPFQPLMHVLRERGRGNAVSPRDADDEAGVRAGAGVPARPAPRVMPPVAPPVTPYRPVLQDSARFA